jgi:nucleotide-binding universal stress UspA family protein
VDERPTIVVGVDGSAGARAALRYAFADAARRNARIQVVSAFDEPEYWAVAYGMSAPPPLPDVTAGLEKAARQMVDEVRAEQRGGPDVPVEVQGIVGSPAKVLLEQARDADLLVLGHRGLGGFASAMLGSVGLQCVLHAQGPVTIVRDEGQADEDPRRPR